jgi:FkbM family methyltransferase
MGTELVVAVEGGARICVPDTLVNATTYVLLEQERWFEDELGFVRACLAPGQCAVDVGANLGVFTTTLAAGVGPTGRVLAFEPTSSIAALLERTLEVNDLPHTGVIRAALADRAGRGLLQIGDTPELNALTDAPGAGHRAEAVNLLTLDDALRDHGVAQIDFLKIDAEGAELRVGLGARRTLAQSEPLVLFEIRHGDSPRFELLELLGTHGLAPYRLIPGLDLLVPFRRDEPIDDYQLNLFACTSGRAAMLHSDGLLVRAGPLPEVRADPDDAAGEYLRALPGARANAPAAGAYGHALIHYAMLQTADLEPAAQAAHLGNALGLAERAFRERASVARLMTFARLAADAGSRRKAVDLLGALIEALRSGAQVLLDEPCLPPHPRYAGPVAVEETTEWVRCAAIETFERRRAFSSLYIGPAGLPPLEFLRGTRYHCAELERRRQLLRLRSGAQAAPEPHPILSAAGPENLNPWFWTGSA